MMRAPSNARTIVAGDRVSIRRHSGAALVGTVTRIGEWEPSCAGTPMRWIDFTDSTGTPRMVADTPFRDNDVTVIGGE